jgi:hypothetical protein
MDPVCETDGIIPVCTGGIEPVCTGDIEPVCVTDGIEPVWAGPPGPIGGPNWAAGAIGPVIGAPMGRLPGPPCRATGTRSPPGQDGWSWY